MSERERGRERERGWVSQGGGEGAADGRGMGVGARGGSLSGESRVENKTVLFFI